MINRMELCIIMDNYYFQDSDYEWMREAILEAKKAEQLGEVPIGAVIVKNGEVIGRGIT